MSRLRRSSSSVTTRPDLAKFWAAALDDFDVRGYDDADIARLAALGFTPETDPVVPLDGPHIEICFQKVDLPPLTKRTMYLDLRADDRAREVLRLVQLGASVEERFATHTWMRDPEGNDFCVVDV
jgi:Glyoxalase-like domain